MTDQEREAQIRDLLDAQKRLQHPQASFTWGKESVEFLLRLLDEAREADLQWQEIAGMVMEELTAAGQRGSATPPMMFNDAIRKLRRERDEAHVAERRLSDAYVRLRHMIPGALDTPHAPTAEQVWSVTEAALARLTAPPSTDAEAVAHALLARFEPGRVWIRGKDSITDVARALEAAERRGAERMREAAKKAALGYDPDRHVTDPAAIGYIQGRRDAAADIGLITLDPD